MSVKGVVIMTKKSSDRERIYALERKLARLEKYIELLESMNVQEAIKQAHRTKGHGPICPVYGERLW